MRRAFASAGGRAQLLAGVRAAQAVDRRLALLIEELLKT